MAVPARFYPPLTELLSFEQLPAELGFIKEGLEDYFEKFFYDKLYSSVSDNGSAAFYSLDIVCPEKIAFEFGNTGIALVLNPSAADDDISVFPVTVDWQWEILAYLNQFDSETFSFSPGDFFNIGISVIGITQEHFIELALRAFVEPQGSNIDRIEQFVSDLNDLYSSSIPVPDYDDTDRYTSLIASMEEEGIPSSYTAIFALYLTNSDIQVARQKLNYFFSSFLPSDLETYILDLIIPRAKATLELSLGVEFPPSILQPVNATGEAIAGAKSVFIFPTATFFVDTKAGIGYDTEFSGSLQPPFASVAGTGLIIQLESLKIDLSRNSNIEEANLDGRPADFIGVYARALSVTLPPKWFSESPGEESATLRIGAYDLLVGTGGFSGTILLESVPAVNAGVITEYYDGDFSLDFPVTAFQKNADDTISEVSLSNDADLLQLLNTNHALGYTTSFKFPISLTTSGGDKKEMANIAAYQQYLATLSADAVLWKRFGNAGFRIGFSRFDIVFKSGSIISSGIEGRLVIPNFKDTAGNPAEIIVTGHLFENGDFDLSASVEAGIPICLGDNGAVFKIIINSLGTGQADGKIYVEVSGKLDFSNNTLLSQFLQQPIEVKKLRIYGDGSFEIEGGSIPIPAAVHLNLGPVEVAVTNITLGAEKLDQGNYKYIGFDCGVSTGAGGLDMRGDGIKLYFNHDGSDMFLRIAGIGIDLIIPGTATEETAALILKGYLSIKEEEYTGAVAFNLPLANISGGAAMKMKPKVPAFAVDAFLELSAPIPLGPTGLGIFGFRGMFGLRYIADLPPGATADPDAMFDFYTAKKPNPLNSGTPERGLHLGKIITPEQRADGFESSGTPISIGAGLSLGTAADAGRAFSMQAFLFLSLPEFFMISGKGNILSERVQVVAETEPPFFAYMAITGEYISVGMGADYNVTAEEGEFLELHAEAKMAFFFNDASAWYINFGTKEEPNQGRVLKKIFDLNAYAYLMLSVSGIETGAGIRFEKKKKYGPVSVDVSAYGDIYAMISFRKPQVGGGIACGGTIGARVFGFGFDFILDAYLMLTVPQPFIVKGGASIRIEIDLWLFSWSKTVGITFEWTFDSSNDPSEIKIIDITPFPVSAYHIGSKNTYELNYITGALPAPGSTNIKTIPLDCYIDIQLKKPVQAAAISTKIGGYTNAPVRDIELVPPKEVEQQLTHRFFIDDINIRIYNTHTNSWQNYNPYEALDSGAFLEAVDPSELRIGYWQKKGKEYNNMRILADTPFSFADNMSGEVIPEQMGVTAGTLFCPSLEITPHCTRWETERRYTEGTWYTHKTLTFCVFKKEAVVVNFSNVFNIPRSLMIHNSATLEIILPERSLRANLKLFSYARSVKVSFLDLKRMPGPGSHYEYVEVRSVQLTVADFLAPVAYTDETQTIKKIIIQPERADETKMLELQNEYIAWQDEMLEDNEEAKAKLKQIKASIDKLKQVSCDHSSGNDIDRMKEWLKQLQKELDKKQKAADKLKKERDRSCSFRDDLSELLAAMRKENAARQSTPSFILPEKFNTDRRLNDITKDLVKGKDKQQKSLEDIFTNNESKIKKEWILADKTCRELHREYIALLADIRQLKLLLGQLSILVKGSGNEKADKCSTYIHEVCYLTQQEHWYNISIPPREAVEADYDALNNAGKVIAPIWRPDELYAIEVKSREVVTEAGVAGETVYNGIHYFPFRTAGPIGHFPLSNLQPAIKKQYGLKPDGTLEITNTDFAKKPEIPENALKFYIDYNKSYPNPIGNIINQKPLFYHNPALLLYYSNPYVYHFFNNWPDYNGLGQRFSSMEILIKDPAENFFLPPATPVPGEPVPHTSWVRDLIPMARQSIELVNQLRDPRIGNPGFSGNTCWQIGGDPIIPASNGTSIVAEDLKPSKLYTAVVMSRYSKTGTNPVSKQVHSYPFQTSRYADLAAQVNSYHLDAETDAIYNLVYNLASLGTNISQLRNVISGVDVSTGFNTSLLAAYPDAFQRIMSGYLKQALLPPALHTEIHLLRDENNKLIGVWVRNPEPFNDPGLPRAQMDRSIQLMIDGVVSLSNRVLFSKDNTEFILFQNGLQNIDDSLQLVFSYIVWNGTAYVAAQTITTQNLIEL